MLKGPLINEMHCFVNPLKIVLFCFLHSKALSFMNIWSFCVELHILIGANIFKNSNLSIRIGISEGFLMV